MLLLVHFSEDARERYFGNERDKKKYVFRYPSPFSGLRS